MNNRQFRTVQTTLVRASLAVALSLPLAHAAAAAQETTAPLLAGARFARRRGRSARESYGGRGCGFR